MTEQAQQKLKDIAGELVSNEGKVLLHAIFPNDFEYYLMAFELMDDKNVIERFIFPVNPDSYSSSEDFLTDVKKTTYGVVTLTNNSFQPRRLSLNGTFGRKFRIMLGSRGSSGELLMKLPDLENRMMQMSGMGMGGLIDATSFIPNIKTGYGALRLMEKIIQMSKMARNGKPLKLIFYNMTYNEQWVVRVNTFAKNMSKDNNMVWEYSLEMDAVAPAAYGTAAGQALRVAKMATVGAINQQVNNTIGKETTGFIGKAILPFRKGVRF